MFETKCPVFKCFKKNQKGYTLIELLVVIAVLGVIAAVAVPNIVKFMDSGETEAAGAELHNVQVAASAAVHEGDGECEPINEYAQIFSTNGNGIKVGDYLINDTTWEYIVTEIGVVEQGDKA